jgi:phosphate transport system substrate-binding protein
MPEGVAAVKLARPAALLVIGLLTLAACQPSASQSPTGSEPPESGAPSGDDLEGDLQVIGSSTVEPIASLAMTAFGNLHPNVTYTVDGPGTGPGMEQFCADETDVGLASRTMSEEEAALCEDAGVEWVELKIGIDGLSVITSALNTELTCLSFLDLYALLGPESEGLETWDAANDLAAELDDALAGERGESHAPYPAEDLIVTAPGDESGTYASFVDLAIRGIADDRGQERSTTPRPTRTRSSSRVSPAQRTRRSPWAGWATPSPTRTATRSPCSRSTAATAASPRPRRRSNRPSTRCRGSSTCT